MPANRRRVGAWPLLLRALPPLPPPSPAADTQGDISQARGQLGQLLFEFSQIELNRDLLEAIKRTESKTGEVHARAGPPQQAVALPWAEQSA